MSDEGKFDRSLLRQPWGKRLEYFIDRRIPHERMEQVKAAVKSAIRRRDGKGFIFVVGPTRIGKTTVLEYVVKSMLEEAMEEMRKDVGCIPVAWMEAAAYPRGYDWKDHWAGCLEALREPLIEHKTAQIGETLSGERDTRAFVHESRTGRILRRAFESAARQRKLRVFFIDEAQHLTLVPSSKMYRAQLEIIKSVASHSWAMHVMFGTYDLLKLRNASGQLGSRAVTVHFNRYRPNSKTDVTAFADALLSLASYMPLHEVPNLRKDLDYCFETSLGCIGLLKVWLTDALGAALEAGRRTLTRKDLESHEPPIDVLDKISYEIIEGEKELESDEQRRSIIRLRMLRGSAYKESESSRVPSEDQRREPVDQSNEVSEGDAPQPLAASKRAKKGKKVERKPKRDKVGGARKRRAA